MTSNQDESDQILLSLRLGWLSVETFGRLRRWARSGRAPAAIKGDARQRFDFSDREPSPTDQVLTALQQLEMIAAIVVPDMKPPIPDNPDVLFEHARQDIDAVWMEFEIWSHKVWNALQVSNPLAGQAFTYGGSLVDTCWHADGAGLDKLGEMLRAQRLEAIAERFESTKEYLPNHAGDVIHATLERWRIADKLENMDEKGKKSVLAHLETQTEVWHDLIFGLQRAESYLREGDRRWITWGARIATAVLVVLVSVAVWLAVLLLSRAGWELLSSATGITAEITDANSPLKAELLKWQNLSALLASISSVVVILTGFIKSLSGWMIAFHKRAKAWLTWMYIRRRTYRDWRPQR
jgi:hypothetical protein